MDVFLSVGRSRAVTYSESKTYMYDVISIIHATDATGEGGGGKNARDKDLQCEWRGWGSHSDGLVKNHLFHAAATPQ